MVSDLHHQFPVYSVSGPGKKLLDRNLYSVSGPGKKLLDRNLSQDL
jgi:hypothetical protein